MNTIDLLEFIVYMLSVAGIGIYIMNKVKGANLDPEMGLPLLLRKVLPVGLMGIMMSAYFSAIMSTADSCLIAASGNVTSDILRKIFKWNDEDDKLLGVSQIVILVVGVMALVLASQMQNVLNLMLYSYAFMVSGLLIPILGVFFWKGSTATGALWSMIVGGITNVFLSVQSFFDLPLGLDANIFGISASLLVFVAGSKITKTVKLEIQTA